MLERAVNPRQLDVLKWIVAGCPDGVMTGTSYKTTAVALQGRRLADVSRKGGAWRATATSAGHHYVEHGAYPEGHWAVASANRSAAAGRTRVRPRDQASVPPRPTNTPAAVLKSDAKPALRPVDQMMADLAEAGGTLTVKSSRSGYWEGLASAATRFGKVPEGQLLHVARGTTWEERVLRLADKPSWMMAVLEPVLVSQHLRKPHPAVAALRDDKYRLTMTALVRSRALRILDALAKEAVARGYGVAAPAPRADTATRRNI